MKLSSLWKSGSVLITVCAAGRPNKSRFSFAIRLHWRAPPHLPTFDLEKRLHTAVCECMCVCVGFIRAQWRESMNYREASRVSTIRSGFSHATPPHLSPPPPPHLFFWMASVKALLFFSLAFDSFHPFSVTLALLIRLCRIGLCLVFTEESVFINREN